MVDIVKLGLDKYSTKICVDKQNTDNQLNTLSLSELQDILHWLLENASLNEMDIEKVPVIAEFDNKKYVIDKFSFSFGSVFDSLISCNILIRPLNQIVYTGIDARPDNGEYIELMDFSKNGTELTGKTHSDKAAMRILRFVRYVLENDDTYTHIKYAENNEDFIQIIFSDKEFDIQKIKDMVGNTGIITEEIIKLCKKNHLN